MSSERSGTVLCLSGGGFRAAAFHLGAVRRINELGLLSGLRAFSAVSGGALFLMHLAVRLGAWLEQAPRSRSVYPTYESDIAVPFRRFLQRDLRTGVLLRAQLDVFRFGRRRAAEQLAAELEKRLGSLLLCELPARPQFLFNATNMESGTPFVFAQTRMGDYRGGFRRSGSLSVARAAAISAAYPPVFGPARPWVGGPRLSDGGVYDNLGLEPVWKHAHTVLISDGGRALPGSFGKGTVALLARTVDVLLHQNGSMRKRALFGGAARAGMKAVYCALLSDLEGDADEELFARVRTDLDGFSRAEVAALENRGYLSAARALSRARIPARGRAGSGAGASLVLPHPAMVGPAVALALADSARRRWPFFRFARLHSTRMT